MDGPPHMFTWIEDSRPEELTMGVEFCVESDLQVQHTRKIHLDLKLSEKRTREHLLFHLFVPFLFFPFTGFCLCRALLNVT